MRALVLLACLIPSAALAQRSDAIARARPHFEAAQQYYEDGEFALALREFRRAHELTSEPELLYNIAVCYERLGDFEEAVASLERYLANEREVAERAAAEDRLRRLRASIAQRAELDGAAASPDPVVPEPIGAPPPAAAPIPIAPIVVFAIAGATLIAGVALGSAAVVRHDELLAQCGDLGCSEDRIAELNALTISADVMFGVSLAAATVGLVLALVLPEENRSPGGVAWRFE
jgi:tetratricopeptide (TPR) repeat protein